MTTVKIITPTGMFGSSSDEHFITTAMRIIGVGFGEEGDWCAKYGVNVETDVFAMRRFYWGDCDCGWGDKESEWHTAHKGRPDYDASWQVFLKDNPGHLPTCSLELPNFLYKPTGFALSWYKYIGRDMEVKVEAPLPGDFMERIFASHPKSITVEQAVAEAERQEGETADAFAKMFANFNTANG